MMAPIVRILLVWIDCAAQEQNAPFPEFVVKGNDDQNLEIKAMMEEGAYGLSYERHGVVAMQGLKELHALVRAQAERIADLESRLGTEES